MAEIADLYTGILGRAPDAAGLQYWEQQLAGGMPIENIRQSFINVASAGTDPLKAQAAPLPLQTQNNPSASVFTGASGSPITGFTTSDYRDLAAGLGNAVPLHQNPVFQSFNELDRLRSAPILAAQQQQYNTEGYVGPTGWKTTPTDILSAQIAANPNVAEGWRKYLTPEQQGQLGNAPGGVLGTSPSQQQNRPPYRPVPPPAFPQRPPYAAESPFSGGNVVPFPFQRPMGNYWQGNQFFVPNFSTPQPRPVPGLLPAGQATASGGGGLGEVDVGDIAAGLGIPAAALVAGLNAGRPEVINAIQALPGGATALRALGISGPAAGATTSAGGVTYELLDNGRVRRVPAPNAANTPGFGGAFADALSPNLFNVGGAVLAGLPDILQGDYAQGIGAGGGSYLGGAAGSAVASAAGLGGVLGNFALPGVGALAGSVLGKQIGKLFGPGDSVGPNAGANLAINNGVAQWQSSNADNKGNTQYVDQFINAVAMGVNEMAQSQGVKLRDGGYRVAVEVLGGKLSVVGPDGVKKSFNPDQAAEAYEYAVNSILRDAGGK